MSNMILTFSRLGEGFGNSFDSHTACVVAVDYLLYPTVTLNRYPTRAVSPIATVPQNEILMMALVTLEPPVLAAREPRMMRKKIANP